ncbi:MAG: hypothetical protein RDU76_04665 [Candidatus Edwardsbacteria bacterium]|nr:hypothetical protein [Candidatus Edwardsbacteria bacterium]
MKTFLTIALCVSLTSIASGARDANTILGIWVGNNSEGLFIMDTLAYFETDTDKHKYNYTLRGDSLELFFPHSTQVDNSDNMLEETHNGDGLCFIIERHDEDSLVLRPYRSSIHKQHKLTSEYEYLFDSTNTITLRSIFSFKDTLLSFNRLLYCRNSSVRLEFGYHQTNRVGEHTDSIYYPPGKFIEKHLKIIIDSTKAVYLYGDKYYMQSLGLIKHGNKNALKQGYYQGCLSDSQYKGLIFLLSISDLDRMQLIRDTRDSSALEYSLDIYYNNKYKRTVGTYPPLIGFFLFTYLSFVDQEVPLVKSKTAKKMFEQFYKKRDK